MADKRAYGMERSNQVNIRFNPSELATLETAAKTLGMSKVDYIRKVLDNSLAMSGFKAA